MPEVTPTAPTPAPAAPVTDAIDTGSDASSVQKTLDSVFNRLPYASQYTAGTLGQPQQSPTLAVTAHGQIIPPAMPWVKTENSVGTATQTVIEPAPFTPSLSPAAPVAPQQTVIGESPTPIVPAPVTAPVTTAAPASDDVAPVGSEAQQKWNELKAAAKEAAVLKQQIAEFEGTKAEYKTLQETYAAALKEREVIESEVYKTRVFASKKFNEQVTKPFDSLASATFSIAKEAELNGEVLFDAMIKGDKKQMLELTASLHPYDQTKVFTMYDKMRELVVTRDNLVADSKSQYEADIKEQEQTKVTQQANRMAERKSALETVIPAITQKIIDILPEADRVDLNSVKDELGNFDAWPENYKVYGVAAATVLPKLVSAYQNINGQLQEAQAEISRLRGGSPKLQAGVPASSPVSAPVRSSQPLPGTTLSQLAKDGTNNILASLGLPSVRL